MGYGKGVSRTKMAAVVIAIFAVAAADIVILDGLEEYDGINDGRFGLSTTEAVMEVGEVKTIAPISYRYLDSVSYSIVTNPENVEMTVTDGICTVKALSFGYVSIEAKSGLSSDFCDIQILEHRDDTDMRVYDMSSKSLGYATLSDSGFGNGELSFSFNTTGGAFIGLASYTSDRLAGSSTRTGSYNADYFEIVMTVSRNGTEVATNTYSRNTDGSYVGVYVPLGSFGEYTVKVSLYSTALTLRPETISGTFTYTEGSGYMDAGETFHREYAWKYNGSTYSFGIDIPYCEYLMYYYNNLANICYVDSSMYSRDPYELDGWYLTVTSGGNPVTDMIWEELGKICAEKGITGDVEKASFILSFVQICYSYVSDGMQYRTPGAETDYWAFAAETVWSGEGDCEDTSALCTALFEAAGLDAGIFLLPDHAMAGVALDGFMDTALENASSYKDKHVLYCDTDDKMYYCCETTANRSVKIGVVGDDMSGDAVFYAMGR